MVRYSGDVLCGFMNQTRGTGGLELVLARGCNGRVSHFDDNETGTGIRKVWNGGFRKGL